MSSRTVAKFRFDRIYGGSWIVRFQENYKKPELLKATVSQIKQAIEG